MTPAQPEPGATASPETAARFIADGALLLDVREPDEWAAGHSPDAIHVPLGELTPDTLPHDRLIIAVCRSGARSARATTELTAAGFNVRNLTGGMKAWAAAGLPVQTDDGRPGVVA